MPRSFDQNPSPEIHTPRVLKISEMALFYGGDCISEIGNPSYSDRSDFCYYDRTDGAIMIQGIGHGDRLVEMRENDLLLLKGYVGHVPLGFVLRERHDEPLSGREFEHRVYYPLVRQAEASLQRIKLLAQAFGIPFDDHKIDLCKVRVAEQNPHFAPHELWKETLETLPQDRELLRDPERAERLRVAIRELVATGTLTMDEVQARQKVVSFAYAWLRWQGIDRSDPRAVARVLWEDLPRTYLPEQSFYDQLLDEYVRRPDGRFGDTLLIAVSHLVRLREEGVEEYRELV